MKKFLIFIGIIFLLVLYHMQYRHFYRVNDMTFTIWKKWGGFCYITPYRYWGISAPESDYIKTSNVSHILIHIGTDSTLCIFAHYIYADSIICNFENYKYQFFRPIQTSLGSIDKWEEKMDSCYRSGLPFIQMDLRSVYIRTGSIESENK